MVVITPYDKSSLARHREGDPRQRPRRQPDQRRHDHPRRLPAADRGAPPGVRQGRAHTRPRTRRVAIRNVRRHAKDALDKLAKDGEAGEDDVAPRREGARGGHPQATSPQVDELLKHKEAELLEV